MYWKDLSDNQIIKVKKMLESDPAVATPSLTVVEQDEEITDWMNRNNDTETILSCLRDAYDGRSESV